ncbi:MAG: hypothetical protein HFE82_07275, partial [Erysipelotrichaceae bacterium]|nr:hypothetical protein [Erysipelotrichaceae bacterium]
MKNKTVLMLMCILGSVAISYIHMQGHLWSALYAQSAPTFQLPKGSKVVLGKYNNKEIVWDIGNNTNDYVLMSSKPIASMSTYDADVPSITTPQVGNDRENFCLRYTHATYYATTYCPITPLENEVNRINLSINENNVLVRVPFIPSVSEIRDGGSLGLGFHDRAYKTTDAYFLKGYVKIPEYSNFYFHAIQNYVGSTNTTSAVYDVDTGTLLVDNEKIMQYGAKGWTNAGEPLRISNIRPFTVVDKTKVMFAAGPSFTDGAWHSYQIDTANLNKNNELNPNKLRIQSSLIARLQDIKRNGQSTSKVIKNNSVDLSVNANTGTNTKISVILYNSAGTDIQSYKMMESTRSGTNDYTLDLTGIPVGKYQVAVINEEYDASSQLPVESSAISDLMPLEIVEPHKLTYTKTPQSGASAGIDYEFGKNVNAGQAVGKVTASPTGVTPLTYSVETNGDNSYLNFEIDGLDSNNASSNTPLNVKIK